MTLSVYYQNVRGLRSKTHNIRLNSFNCDFDIICLTETNLNSNISNQEILSDDYAMVRRDRDLQISGKLDGGGVMIGIKEHIRFVERSEWSTLAEDLWITISSNNSFKLHICCVYIPPQDCAALNLFIDNLASLCDVLSNDKILICGDFNLPYLKWERFGNNTWFFPNNTYNAISSNFVDTMAYSNLKQFNGELNINHRILDLVLTNIEKTQVKSTTCPLTNIDLHHPPLIIYVECSLNRVLNNNAQFFYNFNRADYSSLNDKFLLIPWDKCFNNLSVIQMVDKFYEIIKSHINLYVPHYKINKRSYPNWYSYELIKLIKKKSRAHLLYIKSKNVTYYKEFSTLRKQVKILTQQCYYQYIKQIEQLIPHNIKKFWSYVSSFKKNSIPSCLQYNGVTSTSGDDISNMFADYFHSVYCSSNFIKLDNQTCQNYNNISLASISTSESEVSKIIMNMKDNVGAGDDGLPSIFVKRCVSSLSYPLSLIYNKSLSDGLCPSQWKRALVIPIHKNGQKNIVENYRPISKLCVFEKILEKIVYKTLFNSIKNVLSIEQHGFVPGRSAESNLVQYTDDIWKSMEDRYQVDSIYTDFSKAFDKINHKLLINKLNLMGIHGSLLGWFESYLSNRSQCVLVNGFRSRSLPVISGVPQGSHLGPLLFIIFINDITQCFHAAKILMYADDLKIYLTIKNKNDCYLLQNDINRFSNYANDNGLFLNINKCTQITFTRNRNIIVFKYSINNHELARVNTVKDLGVMLDTKLIFDVHIDIIVKKAFKMLGFVLRISHRFSSVSTFINLYCSLVRSRLEFASVCWSPHYQVYINRIETIQRRFLYFINNKFPNFPLTLPSLEKRRTYFDIVYLYKILNNHIDAPATLERLGFRVPGRTTRNNELFTLWQCKTNASYFSPLNRICIVYNELSLQDLPDIFCCSLDVCKRGLKRVLFS